MLPAQQCSELNEITASELLIKSCADDHVSKTKFQNLCEYQHT